MKRKVFSMMLAAAALTTGFSSCNNDDEVVNGGSTELKAGDPTSMKFVVTMPRSPRTYAPTDVNATDAEMALNSINVLIYSEATNGTYGLEANGNKSLTMSDFDLVAPDTYELKDANKLSTFTGNKKIMIAMNYPGTLPTAEGAALSDLNTLVYTLSNAQDLTSAGFAMFNVDPKAATLVREDEGSYATDNKVSISVKRLVAKFTVQERIARQSGKIISEGGELTNLQFAVGNANKTIFLKQNIVSNMVQDNNWNTYVVGTSFFGLNYVLSSTDYKAVDAQSVTVENLKTIYAPENTKETYATNGENVTYVSVRAQYAPAFFTDATGASKGANTAAPKTFWTIVKQDGSILYFDVETEADSYMTTVTSAVKSAPYTDGLCYFRVYVNKAANADATIIGSTANPYDVLRNTYYKSMIKNIKAPGTPTDEGDIKTETSIDIDVVVNPWEVVDEEFDI